MTETLRPRVGIVTDGAADGIREKNVSVVPINILFGDDSYETGIDLSNERFRELIETRQVIPTTSVPNRVRFYDAYDSLVGKQDLDVISIHVGSKFSGTCGMAESIAQEYNGRVKVFDTGTVSGAQGLMVMKAQEMANNGVNSEKIMETLTDMKERITLRVVIPNLDYVKKSGRINVTQLYVGKILGLIGIAQIDNNISTPVERIIGERRIINWLTDYATKESIPEQIMVLDYGARKFSEGLRERLIAKGKVPENRINLGDLGPVGSSHGGPGTVGMVVLR